MTLAVNQLAGFSGGSSAGADGTIWGFLGALGHQNDTILCLDAADIASYNPDTNSELWIDRSDQGNDFDLGIDSNEDSGTATFNGSAGGKSASEYFSGDGTDMFEISGDTKPSEIDDLHQDLAAFTLLTAVYPVSTALVWLLNNQNGSGGGNGIGWRMNATDKIPLLEIGKSTPANILSESADSALLLNQWNIAGVSLDEDGGSGTFHLNGSTDGTFTPTYTSPDTGVALDPLTIWSDSLSGGRGSISANGTRIAFMAILSKELSAAEMIAFYTAVNDERSYI